MATNNNSFQQQLEQWNVPTVPTTQTIAQRLGATPQQTAMTGTQAQVQSTIAQRLEQVQQPLMAPSAEPQRQELGRAERLQAPRREATVEEARAAEREEQLGRLGNIGQSIQKTIQENIAAAGQMETGVQMVDQPLLGQMLGIQGATLELAKQDPNSTYNKVGDLLNQYLATGDPNDLETAAAFMDNLKLAGLSSQRARELIGLTQETMAKRTGAVVAENVMDQVTLNDLDLVELGFEGGTQGVADLLGMSVEEVGALTVDQLADKIEGTQKAEFSRIDQMKAELAAAPVGSLRREILMRELRDLGQVGVTGIEQQMAETVEDIDLAGYIKVGDERIKVSDFLDDDQLSQMVMDWINEEDPARRDELIPPEQFPELIAWINSNQMALAQLSETAGDTLEAYDKANTDYQELNIVEGVDLNDEIMGIVLPGYDKGTKVTSKDLAAAQAALGSSTIGQLSSSNESKADKKHILQKITAQSGEDLEELLGMSLPDLTTAHHAAETLREVTGLAKFLGLDESDFILDESVQDNIDSYADVIGQIMKQNPAWLSDHGITSSALKGLTPAQLQTLADNPSRFKDFKAHIEAEESLNSISSADQALQFILGDDLVTVAELDDMYADALKWAAMGSQEAKDFAFMLAKDVFGATGGLPNKLSDIASGLITRAQDSISGGMSDVINGTATMGALSGYRQLKRKIDQGFTGAAQGTDLARWSHIVADGTLTASDIMDIQGDRVQLDQLGKFVDSNPGISVNLDGFTSYAAWSRNRDENYTMEFLDTIQYNPVLVNDPAPVNIPELSNMVSNIDAELNSNPPPVVKSLLMAARQDAIDAIAKVSVAPEQARPEAPYASIFDTSGKAVEFGPKGGDGKSYAGSTGHGEFATPYVGSDGAYGQSGSNIKDRLQTLYDPADLDVLERQRKLRKKYGIPV